MVLRRGKREKFLVEVLSPASKIIESNFNKNVDLLKKELEFVNVSPRVYAKGLKYLADTRENRARTFISALKNIIDFGSGAIVFARGGYGSAHLLPYIEEFVNSLTELELKRLSNVFLVGYSDPTAIMWYLTKFGVHSFYSQNLSSEDFSVSLALLKQLAFDNKIYISDLEYQLMNLETQNRALLSINGEGQRGTLLGGTLSVIASIVGTRFFGINEKLILFLEDINESEYKLDRYLTQLELSGVLDNTKAIILGSFKNCNNYESIFLEFSERLKIPVYKLADKVGHGGFKRWIMFGKEFTVGMS